MAKKVTNLKGIADPRKMKLCNVSFARIKKISQRSTFVQIVKKIKINRRILTFVPLVKSRVLFATN